MSELTDKLKQTFPLFPVEPDFGPITNAQRLLVHKAVDYIIWLEEDYVATGAPQQPQSAICHPEITKLEDQSLLIVDSDNKYLIKNGELFMGDRIVPSAQSAGYVLTTQEDIDCAERRNKERLDLKEQISSLRYDNEVLTERLGAQPAAVPREIILYQYRARPLFNASHPWSVWIDCSEDIYKDYLEVPRLHDWLYEVRSLCATSSPAVVSGETEKYRELLYAVASKFPDETRHQTALRYIQQAESACNGPSINSETTK